MVDLPTGTVTFLFTDIEGSTRLLQHLGDRYAGVLTEQQQLLRVAVEKWSGHVTHAHGDAFSVAFLRAKDALMAAAAGQRALHRHRWPPGASVRVRMGLHTGEPHIIGGQYVGLDVHRAARVCAAGHGGQILLSQTTHDLVADDLPEGMSLRSLGAHRLKDLQRPEHLFQVLQPDLPADFPPLRSLNVLPNNLPIQVTSFIGREREIADVKQLFPRARLLTLTGAGGCGKTRLALQVAAELLEAYPDGVWVVELASISDPSLVPQTVGSALNVREEPGRSLIETLADNLRPKSLLLLLDNCEHLLAACAQLSETLLQCANLQILATSREGLGIAGELTYRVPSLSLPDLQHLPSAENLAQYEAVRLFIERAVFSRPGFVLTNKNASAVTQVCHRLDGIPLAIELAAPRVKALSVEQIASRLDDRFRLLTQGSRTALPRHQTLRGAIDWSYGLLSEEEQALLRRLSVFAGEVTLEAAEAVCTGEGVEASHVLDLLMHLVDKSLLVADAEEGEARYRLLETVRHYGWDRLLEAGEAEDAQGRHLGFFLKFAEEAEPKLEGAEQAMWLNRLEKEHDNLRAALEWSTRSTPETGLRLAAALWRFWLVRGYYTEGRRWLKKALERGTGAAAALRAKALNAAGYLAALQNDYSEARVLLEKSLALYRELGDKRGVATAIVNLGSCHRRQGDYAAARSYLEESLALYRELGDKQGIATSLGDLGHEVWHTGDYAAARSLLEESLLISRELDLKRRIAYVLWSLGLVAYSQGNYGEARSLYKEGLTIAREVGDAFIMAHMLEAVATMDAAEKRAERAARLLGAAEAYREAISAPLPPAHRTDYDRPVAAIRAILDDNAFAAVWAEGRAMTVEQAIEYAQGPLEAILAKTSGVEKLTASKQMGLLTPREQEVAALIARGLSNREIASLLVITERTAETHVQHILNKLGFDSRVQIAVWAIEHGLPMSPTDL